MRATTTLTLGSVLYRKLHSYKFGIIWQLQAVSSPGVWCLRNGRRIRALRRVRTGWSEWYAQMSGRDRFVRNSRCPGTKGHGAGAAAMRHAAGNGERDFCEREVTAAISADRKGSKGRMRTPKGGASGGLWRGYGGGRPALPERTFRTDTRWPGGIRDRP